MLFRPAESSKNIVDFYRNYLLTTFQTNNEEYNRQLKEKLSGDGVISKGPYINVSDSFAKDKTIKELIDMGFLCKSMLNISKFEPEKRKLYRHQVEAIKKSAQKKNLIITTGTGSGKTECFLIPVINELLKQQENGTLDSGVRTLIVYPMNALVNDQIRRLRELFGSYDDCKITYGKFTGETEEKYEEGKNEFLKREGFEPPINELVSREQMRNTPPNILITNYAMLEYLLLRPGDSIFFNSDNAPKWKSIVLDEAHTYGGAKGIEVGTLLKRVTTMLGRNDIQFMLTSATLGDKNADKQIVNFAQSLCNSYFDETSIVRSYTVAPTKSDVIRSDVFPIYSKLAEKIRNGESDRELLNFIEEQGFEIISDADEEVAKEKTLFNLVLQDEFYYRFRSLMLNQTKPLSQIARELKISIEELSDYIVVASNAKVDGDKLFEARYHMFIRGIEGVFVTLKPSNKLFVNKMETYKEDPFDEESKFQVYEISFCHNCNAVFIVGQTNDGYLEQKSKFNDDYSPEVFLLDGEYEETDSDEDNVENKYWLCSKCGAIAHVTSLGGTPCEHEKEYLNKVIKVKDKGDVLHSCPCCHTINTQRSIIRPYFLGSEAATAVIATALYNELPAKKVTKRIKKIEDDLFGFLEEKEEIAVQKLTKQFLTFSDSRQAAAFFSSYLSYTYRNSLMKRIMNQICEEHKELFYRGLSLERFVSFLEEKLILNEICSEDEAKKLAWMTVFKEMVNFKAKNSLQNKGCLYFETNISMLENKNLGLTAEETTNLFKIMALYFIKKGAINLPVVLGDEEKKDLFHGGVMTSFTRDYIQNPYIESWLPRNEKSNTRTKFLKKLFPEMTGEYIVNLLKKIWDIFYGKDIIVINDQNNYVLSEKAIVVKSVDTLYKCSECRMVSPFNLKKVCTNPRCNGVLERYDYHNALIDDHYLNLYNSLETSNLISKEHTAQLGRNKAYAYQNDFKNEITNVLNCSTTFEMGVDVGTLETVFMRNMPPSPANYAQRAGRAGRSIKSAAYALTFCPNSSHDLNYFKDPVSMIKGTITPPAFNVDNEKIVLRHVFASAFSFFWKENKDLFTKTIGEFFEQGGFEAFKSYLESKPDDLKLYLKTVVGPNLQIAFGISDFKWVEKLFSDDSMHPGIFDIAYKKYSEDLKKLKLEREECASRLLNELGNDTLNKRINRLTRTIRTIEEQKIIEFFSKNNLIPKYGFPVDTVELASEGTGGHLSELSLNRDLSSAISEYAPGSQIVADGKLITSRYIKRLADYAWPKFKYVICSDCKTLNKELWAIDKFPENCRQCGKKLPNRTNTYIIPKFGFIVDNKEPENVGANKPERTYKGAISYIGDGKKITNAHYSLCGKKIIVGTSKMDELAVLNVSNFYICDECGYGEVHDDKNDLIIEKAHKKPGSKYNCSSKMLHKYSIGHEFQTDVVLLKFLDENVCNIDAAWSILYSLLEGLSRALKIDRNEISGCLQWYKNNNYPLSSNYAFVLFDNTPGGAGYVRQLRNTNMFIRMLNEGFKDVNSCTCGGEDGDTACYSCLCNYYNQRQHDILKRVYAIDFYKNALNSFDKYSMLEIEETETQVSEIALGDRAQYNFNGQDQTGMSFNDIWNDILDEIDTETEARLICDLIERTSIGNFNKPFYGGTITNIDSGEEINADLVWPTLNVSLHLLSSHTAYEKLKGTRWNCYCLSNDFLIDEFIEKIKG